MTAMHDGEPRFTVLFQIFRTSQLAGTLLDQALLDSSLTPQEFAVYSYLRNVDAVSPSAMGAALGMPATTVSGHARRLVDRGHARKIPDPDDGRSYRLRMTPSGRRVHEQTGRLFEQANVALRTALQSHGDTTEDDVFAALDVLQQSLRDAVESERAATHAARLDQSAG